MDLRGPGGDLDDRPRGGGSGQKTSMQELDDEIAQATRFMEEQQSKARLPPPVLEASVSRPSAGATTALVEGARSSEGAASAAEAPPPAKPPPPEPGSVPSPQPRSAQHATGDGDATDPLPAPRETAPPPPNDSLTFFHTLTSGITRLFSPPTTPQATTPTQSKTAPNEFILSRDEAMLTPGLVAALNAQADLKNSLKAPPGLDISNIVDMGKVVRRGAVQRASRSTAFRRDARPLRNVSPPTTTGPALNVNPDLLGPPKQLWEAADAGKPPTVPLEDVDFANLQRNQKTALANAVAFSDLIRELEDGEDESRVANEKAATPPRQSCDGQSCSTTSKEFLFSDLQRRSRKASSSRGESSPHRSNAAASPTDFFANGWAEKLPRRQHQATRRGNSNRAQPRHVMEYLRARELDRANSLAGKLSAEQRSPQRSPQGTSPGSPAFGRPRSSPRTVAFSRGSGSSPRTFHLPRYDLPGGGLPSKVSTLDGEPGPDVGLGGRTSGSLPADRRDADHDHSSAKPQQLFLAPPPSTTVTSGTTSRGSGTRGRGGTLGSFLTTSGGQPRYELPPPFEKRSDVMDAAKALSKEIRKQAEQLAAERLERAALKAEVERRRDGEGDEDVDPFQALIREAKLEDRRTEFDLQRKELCGKTELEDRREEKRLAREEGEAAGEAALLEEEEREKDEARADAEAQREGRR